MTSTNTSFESGLVLPLQTSRKHHGNLPSSASRIHISNRRVVILVYLLLVICAIVNTIGHQLFRQMSLSRTMYINVYIYIYYIYIQLIRENNMKATRINCIKYKTKMV